MGRRGYDPEMLLSLFVYAMAHGESSSRQIERLCHTDVAFRVICAQDVPDHTVLARFRRAHEQALTDLLTESLVLAAELGMVSLGVVAFDGTKIAASASKDANHGEAHLRTLAEQFVSTVEQTDAAEDDLFGEQARGDELPERLRDRTHRAERIDQALDQVQRRRQAAEQAQAEQAEAARAYEQAAADKTARPRGRPPAGADPLVVARLRWERERAQAQQRYDDLLARRQGQRRRGRPPVAPDQHSRVRKAREAYFQAAWARAASAEQTSAGDSPTDQAASRTSAGKGTDGAGRFSANVTDPDSRLLATRNGWVQGYNCQTATSADGFFVCARATQDANDVAQFRPTADEVSATAERLASHTCRGDLTVGTMLGDAGYDSADNLDADGPDRLIADGKRRHIDQRAATNPTTGDPPEHASPREKMNHRLATPDGHQLYKRRAPLVEAPNAWLKDARGLRRFARRGLSAAQSELSFACAVNNLLKLSRNGITATQLAGT